MWTTDRYRQFLRSAGLTQMAFAALLGHSRRTGQYWATEAVPPSVETLARLLERRPELVDVVAEIAAERAKEPATT